MRLMAMHVSRMHACSVQGQLVLAVFIARCLRPPLPSTVAVAAQVTALRPGRYYAVRICCTPVAMAPGEPAVVFPSQCSQLQVFRTVPTPPGPMQAPALSQRARNALKVGGGVQQAHSRLKVVPCSGLRYEASLFEHFWAASQLRGAHFLAAGPP
jgi:hypothetical protein